MLPVTAMRIGIVSDTHGFIDPAVLTATRSCELLIHAGDIGNAEVLRALRRSGARVVAVRGNNDDRRRWPKAQASTLQRLPRESALELPGGQLVVVHGDRLLPASRRHEGLRRRYPQARAVVYGHSHRLVCDRARRPWVLNPGAAGRSRTFGGPSCLILYARPGRWELRALRFAPASARRQLRQKV